VTTPIFTNNGDFASRLNTNALSDLNNLMALQSSTSSPESDSTKIVSDPLLPDRNVIDRLGHMDPEIYDLSESSHLMKFMSVLLGGAGAGGLRKQIAVARLQNSFRGMHFLDLDRFYGALFGVKRTQSELMPDFGTLSQPAVFNPYTDAAGSDVWDDVHSRDASYRDRLIKFARAIPHGASYTGLKAAAEALLNVECEVYESWTWVDEAAAAATQAPVLVYTWTSVKSSYPTWSKITGGGHTWGQLTGKTSAAGSFLGRTGQKNRGEVLIQPKRQIQKDEQYEVVRVLDRLKPAGTQITVDPDGLAIHQPVPLRAVAADSEHWEIIYRTTANPVLVAPEPTKPIYPEPDPKKCQPRPALSGYQGEKWCHNNDIVKCHSYRMIGLSIVTTVNFDTRIFIDRSSKSYHASLSILSGSVVASARSSADGIMTAFPFADRQSASEIKNATVNSTRLSKSR
jgi:hypothetical protein